MAKKNGVQNEEVLNDPEEIVNEVETKTEIIFVNDEKLARAKEIIAFVLGKKNPLTAGQVERKEKWSEILSSEKIDAKKESTVQWVYEKLGGVVRTHEEQVLSEKKVAAMKKKKNYEE